MRVDEFTPANDIPPLTGKTILLTGGTAGLGAATIANLAAHKPSHIFFTGRNQKSADASLNEWRSLFPNVQFTFVACDLTSLEAVNKAAASLLSQCPKLDIMITNAGIMAVPAAVTRDGYESQFGTNHMGHALLIQRLIPALLAAPEPRLVALSSQGYAIAPKTGISFEDVKPDDGKLTRTTGLSGAGQRWVRYGQGKLANILYTEQLSARYPKISSIAVHPGVIADNGLVSNLPVLDRAFVWITTIGAKLSPEDGAKNTCWAATCDKKQLDGWAYVEPVGDVKDPAPWDKEKREVQGKDLWEWTEKELRPWL